MQSIHREFLFYLLNYITSTFFSWIVSLSFMWSVVEVHVGMIVACVPGIKPLAMRYIPGILGRIKSAADLQGNAFYGPGDAMWANSSGKYRNSGSGAKSPPPPLSPIRINPPPLAKTSPESQDEGQQTAAEREVDTAVFRQQYIPQTLEQVYDFERDAAKVHAGEGSDLVYRDLLADEKAAASAADKHDSEAESDASGGISVDGSDSEDDDEKDPFDKKAPRGRRFEDKDEKRDHKQKVKEEKREKRANKMPKHMKKRLVSGSSRKKK